MADPILRCEVTGNPVGTDTWAVGHSCPCAVCQRWLDVSWGPTPPVEDRPLVVGDVIDFIDEHGNEWTRSRRVEAWLAAKPASCRHPGAVAVETVTTTTHTTEGELRLYTPPTATMRVTALYCPTCRERIEVGHGG